MMDDLQTMTILVWILVCSLPLLVGGWVALAISESRDRARQATIERRLGLEG